MELILSAIVLAVLVLLLVTAFRSLKGRAEGVGCANSMRQLGTAFFAYRGDHNGWFPPGYPASPRKIEGVSDQPGLGSINLLSLLAPKYIGEIPLCPGMRLNFVEKSRYPDEKSRLRDGLGGSYAINACLLQWRLEAMPYPSWGNENHWKASKVPLLVEVGGALKGASNSTTHLNQALNGISARNYGTLGRSHGADDALNFLFLDGHMELIRRNDSRPEANSKSWIYPENPDGRFSNNGTDGRYIRHTEMKERDFINHYYPN